MIHLHKAFLVLRKNFIILINILKSAIAVLLLLALPSGFLYCQKLLTPMILAKNYKSDFFKNVVVRDIAQTPDGIIWIATQDGLYKILGDEVVQTELPANYSKTLNTFLLKNDSLFAGSNEGLYCIVNGKVTVVPVYDRLHNLIRNYIQPVEFTPQNNLIIYTGNDTAAYYSINLATKKSTFLFNKSDGFRALKKEDKVHTNWLWAVETTGLLEHKFANNYQLLSLERLFIGKNNQPELGIDHIIVDGETLYATTGKGVLVYNYTTKKYTIEKYGTGNDLITDMVMSDSLLYAATPENGLFVVNRFTKKIITHIKHIAEDETSLLSNSILKINWINKNILCVVTTKGVSLLTVNNKYAQQFAYNMINSYGTKRVLQTATNIYITDDEKLYVADNDLLISSSYTLPGEPISGIQIINGNPVVYSGNHVYVLRNNRFSLLKNDIPIETLLNIRFILPMYDNITQCIVGCDNGLWIGNLNTLSIGKLETNFTTNYETYQFGFWNKQYFVTNTYYSYIETLTGNSDLFSLANKVETFFNVFDALPLNDSSSLLATTSGAFVFNHLNKSLNNIFPQYTGNFIKIFTANNDTFLLSEKNVYIYKNKKIIPVTLTKQYLQNSIANNNCILLHPDLLLFETGVASKLSIKEDIDDDLLANFPVTVYLNDSILMTKNNYTLSSQDFSVDVIKNEYLPFYKTKTYYRLNDNNWKIANGQEIDFSNLFPGSYKLELKVSLGNVDVFHKTISLTIRPKWYQSLWFFGLLLLAFALLTYWGFTRAINNIKNKKNRELKLQNEIHLSKEVALRAQMNPHFMFNTLNAIHSYIIENRKEDAGNYLMKFSKLMRNTLDNSKNNSISLKKEIENLQLYLELECLRLEDAFDYEIKIDKNIDANQLNISPLILQPFVENAIWHGLVNSKKEKNIWINIKKESEHIVVIEIEDNGIGLLSSKQNKVVQSQHQSYGMEITKSRIKLMNELNQISATDKSTYSNASGTLVKIVLYI